MTAPTADIPELVVCVPINLDVFQLNEKVCDTGLVRIAPITQPDYLGLRPDPSEIQHDILPQVDINEVQPSSINPRVSAVETPNVVHLDPTAPPTQTPLVPPVRSNRIGNYIHWSLPRLYKAGTAAAQGTHVGKQPGRLLNNENATPQPIFRPVPNRWIVSRSMKSYLPAGVLGNNQSEVWVVESDRLWKVDELDPAVDLETDVSPYVLHVDGDESLPDTLNNQAQVFIGEKLPFNGWQERGTTVPRAPVTVMNSSNIMFADNTIHNPNVFSMIDNFQYKDASGNTAYLTSATCDYYVFGYHADPNDDPLGSGPLAVTGTIEERLAALFLDLDGSALAERLANFPHPLRILCYGIIEGVQYNRTAKPPTPAEKFASLFTLDAKMEPVSIGTTALDSVLTFLQAHSQNEEDIFGPGTAGIAKDVRDIAELLYSQEEGYDSRIKASDLIYMHNFSPTNGGNHYHFDGKALPGGAPAQPSTDPDGDGLSDVDYLNQLNELKLHLDAANRKLLLNRWALFSVWWKFVSDPLNTDLVRQAAYKAEVVQIRTVIQGLIQLISDTTTGLQTRINSILPPRRRFGPLRRAKVAARSIALPSYFQRKDPTLCVAGMDDGWDTRYLGTVVVRFSAQIRIATPQAMAAQSPNAIFNIPFNFTTAVTTPLAPDPTILQTIVLLIRESQTPGDHSTQLGYKSWKGQPWCPLYAEWEATYYHIPFDQWAVSIANSPVGNNHDQVRYTVNQPLYNNIHSTEDHRTVSGRVLILPQPVVNLQAIVSQVLDIAGITLPEDLKTPIARDTFKKSVGELKFISAELTGLTSNLLTISEGSHVQPNIRIPEQTDAIPLAVAVAAGAGAGLTQDDVALIGDQSAQTPYGSLVDFTHATKTPFKPVTHGQLRFTKLNIIDKFGQVISAIQPKGTLRKENSLPDTIHPCLSDQVCPGLIENNKLNTVTPLTAADPQLPGTPPYPLCPYVQLTPAINQDARLNLAFVLPTRGVETGKFNGWRAVTDWEQPIWGWVVVNYADYGLQFFTGDGTFYVEMNLGGSGGTITSPKWLPFDPPTQPDALVSPQLNQLITKFTGPGGTAYLLAFWDMITKAIENMPFAPPEYAAYASSIVGKPLALTNAGFSLELSTAPLISQVTLPPTSAPPEKDLLSYKFPVKIGDALRPFDGVVGYFDTDNTTTGATDWDKLHTYFGIKPAPTPAPAGDPRQYIEPVTFPTLSPYYVEPDGPLKDFSFTATHASHFIVKTLLMDPYAAIHLYSPILPITELKLPAWSVQVALQKMTAFFTLGPCLVTKDIPKAYEPTRPLSTTTWIADQQKQAAGPDTAPIRLPIAGKKGSWNWLQPYAKPGENVERRYNSFQVGEEDGRIRLDPAPYTMVEGFLQLSSPLTKRDINI